MSTGLQYIAKTEFTGGNSSTLPVIIPGLPVSGYTRRFVASTIQQDTGTNVALWKDVAGSGTALAPVNSQPPTLGSNGGIASVIFNGTNQGLQQSVAMPNPNTLVIVANIITPNTTGTTALSGSFATAAADSAQLQTSLTDLYANAGTSFKVGAGLNITGWRVIVVSFNGASTVVNINGTEYTGNAGSLPREIFTIGFQRAAQWSNLAVAEAVLYNGAMGASDRAATVAALRERYGF